MVRSVFVRSRLVRSLHLVGARGANKLSELLRRKALISTFHLHDNLESVLGLMRKYMDLPIGLADACLVRMTETLPDPLILTTDADFRIYRRHSRQIVPCLLPY